MSYIKAENVLPQGLIEAIQQYVDGKNDLYSLQGKTGVGQYHFRQGFLS